MKKALSILATLVIAVAAGALLFSLIGVAVFLLPLLGGAFAAKH